jgi:AraC family transcriptional regulator of adaptative response / DNA-3-methyladenine glycosylase II
MVSATIALLFNNCGFFMSITAYQNARASRDARFDGLFFVGVITTGIYCRPICPAPTAHEKNVKYFDHAWQAQDAGLRPCLRCRPDASPASAAWAGTDTSFYRALKLIDDGALEDQSIEQLAERLGMGSRHLRKLFQQKLGIAPLTYHHHRQCEFAKQLLHNSSLKIADIALASGFGSVRQFNQHFKHYAGLTPTEVRGTQSNRQLKALELPLYYRPPYNWQQLHGFLQHRLLNEVEWLGPESYGRRIQWGASRGEFTATHQADKHRFIVHLTLNRLDDLRLIVKNIRRVLDLDADSQTIFKHLQNGLGEHSQFAKNLIPGLRLPGIWSSFEAGIRAIIGQQISVPAARTQLRNLIRGCGDPHSPDQYYFPSPASLYDNPIDYLKMPGARKDCLRALANYYRQQGHDPAQQDIQEQQWLAIKGIGPWTVNYAKMRGLSHPDIFISGDLGIKKALQRHGDKLEPSHCSPWQSYLNMQMWSTL